MALGLSASSSSASCSIRAEKRICRPAVPFNEATLPASVVISYFAEAVALGCTTKTATSIRTRNVVNKRVFIQYSPQSMEIHWFLIDELACLFFHNGMCFDDHLLSQSKKETAKVFDSAM